MATLASLERYTSLFTPGAPLVVLQQMVRLTTQDFLIRTEAWKETISSVTWPDAGDIVLGTNGQPTASTAGAVVARFVGVLDAEQKFDLPFCTRAQLDLIDPSWYTASGEVPKLFTTGASPDQLRIYPLAASPKVARLRVRAALTVGPTSVAFPDFVFWRYQTALTHGAVARVLAIPGRDWSDPRLAATYAEMYENAVIRAKAAGDSDHGNPVRTVTYGGI